MEKIDSEIDKVNDQLRAARCRVMIQRHHDRLVLRGTLPPRPESTHSKPYRQRLSLGMIYATQAGLRAARKQALKVSEQLDEGRFTWADWVEDPRASHASAWWVAEFERDYFNRRGRNPKVETPWDKDFSIPFGRLPQEVPLSAEVLLGAIAPHQQGHHRPTAGTCHIQMK